MSKGLHKSKIDYVRDSADLINRPGYVLNIVTGCKHGCEYCYARRMVEHGRLKGHPSYPYGFEPTFHPERVRPIGGKPKLIFLNDMGDVGGDWAWMVDNNGKINYYTKMEIVDATVKFANLNPQHILLLLTKNPLWYRFAEWPENVMCGFSATDNEELDFRMDTITGAVQWKNIWVSCEPWLDESPPEYEDFKDADWLVIGGMSGPNAKPVSEATLDWLIDPSIEARRFTKANAVGPCCDLDERFPREYPNVFRTELKTI